MSLVELADLHQSTRNCSVEKNTTIDQEEVSFQSPFPPSVPPIDASHPQFVRADLLASASGEPAPLLAVIPREKNKS